MVEPFQIIRPDRFRLTPAVFCRFLGEFDRFRPALLDSPTVPTDSA